MTAIHLPTDPVPAVPAADTTPSPAPRPRPLQRFLRWIDDGLADLGSDD